MWQYIERAIESATKQSFIITEKEPISGGDINLAYRISSDKQDYFVKINDKAHLINFENEAFSLKHIKEANCIATPEVITLGSSLDKSFLILKYLAFSQPQEKSWFDLGEQLALMHKASNHGQFGWQQDNFIGDNQQPNQWSSNWRTFFSEQRIAWQLQLLSEKSIILGDIDHIAMICHDLLQHHVVTPCLVHGDLWQGNIGFMQDTPVIFDPACYYGDREVDVAMTELFGVFPRDFYLGYQETYPIKKGFEQRKIIYNFYHILNHANLFGGIYIEQAKAMLARVLSLPL